MNGGGNSCFLNATLQVCPLLLLPLRLDVRPDRLCSDPQSLASVSSVQSYLEAIVSLGDSVDVSTPMCTSLLNLFGELNTPCASQRTLHPRPVAQALFDSSPSRRHLMNSEQQDAQEFFVMLAEAVSEELQGCEEEQAVDPGLLAALSRDRLPKYGTGGKIRNPFKALMAHRTSCLGCGYTEAVRHLPSEHVTLNVPLSVRPRRKLLCVRAQTG
jgi:ubiquitin carboxyl-terminal hydrolase 1